jgi:Protein of unknown function (DUF2845)
MVNFQINHSGQVMHSDPFGHLHDSNRFQFRSGASGLRGHRGVAMTRIRSGCLALGMLVTLLMITTSAFGLRCGVHLISEGDPKDKVLAQCGEPSYVEAWEEERVMRDFLQYQDPRYRYRKEFTYREPILVKIEVKIEEWTYNHGPHRFVDCVRFENGRVTEIISGDYGY